MSLQRGTPLHRRLHQPIFIFMIVVTRGVQPLHARCLLKTLALCTLLTLHYNGGVEALAFAAWHPPEDMRVLGQGPEVLK
eukprot:CAMPEP_0179464334 /NCGR_PEP_ID=MMETSP0799-20121207/46180_1 /TAXON_ID=46947 /ORGANISM="Geminigera cryophila, Strain CCMP2564" /LENGTH=79 /DNA_ID=CAMNT_0021268073 /DNA_START=509 /DNA_END=749 /DNA_ORIENTATION=-